MRSSRRVYEISEQQAHRLHRQLHRLPRASARANYEQQTAAYKNQQKEIARAAGIRRPLPLRSPRRPRRRMSKLKQIERMEQIEKPLPPTQAVPLPDPAAAAQRPARRWRSKASTWPTANMTSIAGLDLDVERGERTVLVGPNGAGKSTLLKILAGVLEFQKGERKLGLNAKIGYFSQHRAATLDPGEDRAPGSHGCATARSAKTKRAASSARSFSARTRSTRRPRSSAAAKRRG